MLLRRKEVYIIVKTVIDIERLHWYFFTKYFLIEKFFGGRAIWKNFLII